VALVLSRISSFFFYPEDGGDTFFRNIGYHNIYTAPHPRKLLTSQFIVAFWISVSALSCQQALFISVS
jgi:hypothetical protein